MNRQKEASGSYHRLSSGDSTTNSSSRSDPELYPVLVRPTKTRWKWAVAVLAVLLVATNVGWVYHQELRTRESVPTVALVEENTFPPTRTILQPIYQDTEFNEDGKNKERADNLWKSLFPDGNGVISLNKSEAKAHGLHDTAEDPTNPNNALYIIAGFHTMHCVTVLRTSLIHYYLKEKQTAPWAHIVHCLDMVRQTLMCNVDATLMWLHDPDTFADGQLHVCRDFWQLHHWASQHAG